MRSHWIRDPSLHFAIIGCLLFAASSLWPGNDSGGGEIVVSENRVNYLSTVFERSWQRPPEPQELQGLVEDYVREEVLYREAVRLGLDRDDTVIRRRMRMKMELLARDLVDAIDPGDEVLSAYFRRHIDRYTVPAHYTFEQIYLDSNRRPEVAEDARLILGRLTAGEAPRDLGDPSLLQHRYRDANEERIDRLFGGSFALQLRELDPDEWAGPVTSAFGEHLVRVSALRPAHEPDYARIRDTVLRDWQEEERKRILQVQYETLRSHYRVEMAGTTAEVAGQ